MVHRRDLVIQGELFTTNEHGLYFFDSIVSSAISFTITMKPFDCYVVEFLFERKKFSSVFYLIVHREPNVP